MWTKGQAIVIAGVCVLAAAVLFGLGYRASTRAAALVPPPPAQLAVWLPADAEIRTADEVRPGTFSVTLTLEEFKRRFPTGGLVSYPTRTRNRPDGSTGPVTIWHAEPGSAVFYKVEQQIPWSRWSSSFVVGTLRVESGSIVAYPERVFSPNAFWLYILSVVCGVTALVAIVSFFDKLDNPVVRPT